MKAKTTAETARLAVIGVDIGKEVFHLVAFDTAGNIAYRKKIRRLALADTFEQLPRIGGMEACLSAHFVGRTRACHGTRTAHHPGALRQTSSKPWSSAGMGNSCRSTGRSTPGAGHRKRSLADSDTAG
jgi:hypothetical protein